mgnify:CR=1 FL=1
MLYIEHLTKTFGEKKAVDDLSLHIAPGEIYGFIGHNGAGKTTTLKCCCGIQQFDSGQQHWVTGIESQGEASPFFFGRHNRHLPTVSSRYRYSNPAALALMFVTNRGVPTLPDSSICRRSRMAPPPTNTTLQ